MSKDNNQINSKTLSKESSEDDTQKKTNHSKKAEIKSNNQINAVHFPFIQGNGNLVELIKIKK